MIESIFFWCFAGMLTRPDFSPSITVTYLLRERIDSIKTPLPKLIYNMATHKGA